MYRKHFALTRHPFGQEIAPDELCPSASSRELDVRLAHLLDLRRIGLVTGDSGSGKTCAARRVLTQRHTGLYRVLCVSLSTGNVMKTISCHETALMLPIVWSRQFIFCVVHHAWLGRVRDDGARRRQPSRTRRAKPNASIVLLSAPDPALA